MGDRELKEALERVKEDFAELNAEYTALKKELDAFKSCEESFFFTFGSGHFGRNGLSLANCYLELRGTFYETRQMVHNARGSKWAFQYTSAADAGVLTYGLQPVTLDDVRLPETINGDMA